MSVAVTAGDSDAVPSATARTAAAIWRGGVSLSRKPAAPAASAAYTYSSRWKVVRTATCGGSAVQPRAGGQPAAQRADPLRQTDQPVAAAVGLGRTVGGPVDDPHDQFP